MLDSRPLDDPSEIRRFQSSARTRSLKSVLLFIAALMAPLTAVDIWMAPPGDSRAVISMSMTLLALWSYLMLKRKRSDLMRLPLVVGILFLGSWAMYSYGSVRASSSFSLIASVVLAGSFLSLRYVAVTLLASMGILGALTWAEASGRMGPPSFVADVRYWMMASVILAVVGALLYYVRGATDEAHVRRLNQMEDRLRLEFERDQSLRRFGRIFRLNPTALLIQLASTQTVLEVNPAFERSLGYEAERIVGRPAGSLWATDLHWREHLRVLFEKGSTGWQQVLWLRANGQAIDVWVYSELSEDHSGMLITTTVAERLPGGAETAGTLEAAV
ncbi:PAS domain S-box protein [Hydrogenophaga sp. PAMC20947]|uniref:PAS domain S-box protein n=1 Tax=Hydrogenophaga sp. PAMC20947 TaxID=2565558 RepID=UPI00109D9B37|nr:PAS domain S-box protein [Hydrogenophaga sp. PAMC20947]QCB46146.1 PAS domain S-box protein [Hydrogenophaga sp. PAMC20947]